MWAPTKVKMLSKIKKIQVMHKFWKLVSVINKKRGIPSPTMCAGSHTLTNIHQTWDRGSTLYTVCLKLLGIPWHGGLQVKHWTITGTPEAPSSPTIICVVQCLVKGIYSIVQRPWKDSFMAANISRSPIPTLDWCQTTEEWPRRL